MHSVEALLNEIESLRAEIERLKGERVWRDIAEAPRDGTEILVAYARCGFVKKLVYFDKVHGFWKSKGAPELGLENNATHFMPLPAPPAPKVEGGAL